MKRLYLDTRDLIELVTRNEPVDTCELSTILQRERWQLVFSFANTSELVIREDLAETERRFALLDHIPHTYIRSLPPIRGIEFRAAVSAYTGRLAIRRLFR
jgi:hypothetical protein